jgi:hypothetical protein
MLKDFLWKAFIATGDLETYVLYKEMENMCKPKKITFDKKKDLGMSIKR